MRETDALLRELKTITSEIKTFIYYNVPVKKVKPMFGRVISRY